MGRGALLILAMAVAAFLVAAGIFVVRHDWAVEDLMERIHEGKDSPWAVARDQAARETPDWEAVRGPAIGFVEMARALEGAKHAEIRASAEGYATAAAGVLEAVNRADPVAFRETLGGLERSCGDCHFDGGVGGTLRGE